MSTSMSMIEKDYSAAGSSSRTQVSLLPPPWEELTTKEPSHKATRVSAPGMILIFSPDKM